ncbi:MAG: tRNA (adenosine(37)-N6)-dimethylallyltransferase MiaA [Limisphaerales bacterium]
MKLQRIESGIWIGGETASGKSAVALALAEEIGGEVVSVDSMQVYRGLDVGTAKPGVEERGRIRHHLLDVVGLEQEFNVADFCSGARSCIQDILSRGAIPVLCGGTGLYFKALLGGIGSAPESDRQMRRELEATPLPSLVEELREKDPETYQRIDLKNPRRVYRAVEILRMTGTGAVRHRSSWDQADVNLPPFFALRREPEDLKQRIRQRVDRMFAAGLVEETRRLLGEGLEGNRVAMQAIGYRQVVEHLRGERDLESTMDSVKKRTWQFARRQRNWFDRQLPAQRVDVRRDEPVSETLQRILQRIRETDVSHGYEERMTSPI